MQDFAELQTSTIRFAKVNEQDGCNIAKCITRTDDSSNTKYIVSHYLAH